MSERLFPAMLDDYPNILKGFEPHQTYSLRTLCAIAEDFPWPRFADLYSILENDGYLGIS